MADTTDKTVRHLGEILRQSREGRFTVDSLAARSGVSGGLISQLERGIGNPSFKTLMRLAQALGLPISMLFQGVDQEPTKMVVRKSERRELILSADDLRHELLTSDRGRKLAVVQTTVPVGFSNEDTPMIHPGDEVFVVLEGSLRVTVGPDAFELEPGDSISFDSAVPHAISNPGDCESVFLGCSTPPNGAYTH